jgi:quercetin dioxygenase-like cupin family protein
MMQMKPFQLGDLAGTIYDFEQSGDVLPMHEHDEKTVHISIIARGSFKAHGDGWEIMAKSGDVLDWNPFEPHEFVALEPNSRLVNLPKNRS